MLSIAAQGGETESLLSAFCRESRKALGISGVGYWELLEAERLLKPLQADGDFSEKFKQAPLALEHAPVVVKAIREQRAALLNHAGDVKGRQPFGWSARSFLVAPVVIFGQTIGVATFLHQTEAGFFSEALIHQLTQLGEQLGSLLELFRLRNTADQHQKRSADLIELAMDLGSSLRLSDFVKSFTARITEMLGARVGVLALARGTLLEVVALHDEAGEPDRALERSLSLRLTELVQQGTQLTAVTPAPELIGEELATSLGWSDLTIARLTSGQGDLLGLLCLANRGIAPEAADEHLLHAVVGQASVALDNCRLFSRIYQANRHWLEIFDAIEDLIVVHDEGNRVLRVNRSLADSIGARPPELIGISMRALFAFARDHGHGCPFCRRGADRTDDYVHPVQERTYLVSTSRIHGALEEGMQTIHVLKDISERREVERRYRELFDNIHEGLFFSTPEGRFVEVNDALVHMLGYASREELLEVDISQQLYPSPEQRTRFREIIDRQGVLRNFEEPIRRKDGTVIQTMQNTFAVRDGQGKVLQYRGLILDISELKKIQTQLQRERDFSSKILDNTQSMILVADTGGVLTYANRRCYELGAYSDGELVGRHVLEFVHASSRATLEKALETTRNGQQVDNLELAINSPGGGMDQVSANMSPMRDEEGKVTSLVFVLTNITEAVMLQAKLVQAEKMAAIGQLVSGVAHEVNNPLTAILGFADLLADSPEMPDSAKKDLGLILQEAQRTKLIVQNLLSFARKMPPQRQLVQLNSVVRRTLQLRAYDFSNHGVEVVERLHEPLAPVLGDPNQLQQVLLNILNNAYDAVFETSRRGLIEIVTEQREGFSQIIVRDNGPGILHTDRIFDPFFTTKKVGKGTGLGLSICYGIVRDHRGEVLCHNNESGPGATFIIRLPAARDKSIAGMAAAKVIAATAGQA
jgi:two-component system NtrC family sensor kinase